MKDLIKDLYPPLIWRRLMQLRKMSYSIKVFSDGQSQDLDVYWDQAMAEILETWGEGNAWNEIQLMMNNCHGPTLDIACGTGKVMSLLKDRYGLDIHGCDISDMLIAKAEGRGLEATSLSVCDATKLPYKNLQFDYSYSIGSLEHFTEEGIQLAIAEMARVTRVSSFHMMPTSRSKKNEGWLKTYQSFHNCSPEWWAEKFSKSFRSVQTLQSSWEDQISVGSWFLCSH